MDGSHVAAVRIEDEGGVIAGMILRPNARRPVVRSASRQRSTIECIDGLTIRRSQRDMQVAVDRLSFTEEEKGALAAEADVVRLIIRSAVHHQALDPERS